MRPWKTFFANMKKIYRNLSPPRGPPPWIIITNWINSCAIYRHDGFKNDHLLFFSTSHTGRFACFENDKIMPWNRKTLYWVLKSEHILMCPVDTATAGSWAGVGLVNWDLDLLRYWWDFLTVKIGSTWSQVDIIGINLMPRWLSLISTFRSGYSTSFEVSAC
jgi:hypothetical protein